MNGDFIRYRGLIAVAVGAGVMVGAAGVFLYQQLFGERKRMLLQQDINKLSSSVAEIRKELNALRFVLERSQHLKSRNSRAASVGAPSVITDLETEMFSAAGGDDIDDEFYDFSSETDLMGEDDKDSSFEEIDCLLDGSSREDKTKAYGILLELLEKKGDDEEVLWRLAKACHMMGSLFGAEGDNEKKKQFIHKGVEFGQRAMELNHSNWKAHKWFAVCIGARGQSQSVKERLHDGHVFKEHVDAAIAINPKDATLHHLLGRFNYEVASLSWLERKVANTLFGEVPEGTYKNAITSLLEAEKLNDTPWKENRLLLAKCYIAEEDHSQALHWLDLGLKIPAASTEDHLADKEIEALVKRYNRYRTPE